MVQFIYAAGVLDYFAHYTVQWGKNQNDDVFLYIYFRLCHSLLL